MALKAYPIKKFSGFSNKKLDGAYYYSQGFSKSEFGAALLYSIVKRKDSTDISGLSNIKYFAKATSVYAQADDGKIYKETTPGAFDFTSVRSPGGNGAGLLGDQKGRLLYATNSALGMYDGTTWTDSWQSLTAAQHPMDTYEDSVVICNKDTIALLAADDSFNGSGFTFPSNFTSVAIKSGQNGILIGANFGYQGVLALWNLITDRSITPWKYTKGKVLAFERYGAYWIVLTQREILLTDGYSVRQLVGFMDDKLGFNGFETSTLGQRILVVNDTLILLNTAKTNSTYQFGRMKVGVYLIDIPTGYWEFVPASTLNTISVDLYSIFADDSTDQRILLGYKDTKLNKSYIATLSQTAPSTAQYVSEVVGDGATTKTAEAVILNLALNSGAIDPVTMTFNISVKLYNFKRKLWGRQQTNATAGAANQIRVNGTDSTYTAGQAGDEVTILEGPNAGEIAHIASIANPGASNETWTLDRSLPNATAGAVNLNVMPFKLVEKKTFSSISELKNLYFDVKNKTKGKRFMVKVVLDGMSNVPLELQPFQLIYDDLGYDSF